MGYASITADNGREGIERFKENKGEIALVLLDFRMPVMDGMETLKELMRMDPDANVVVCSGNAFQYVPEDFLKAGAKAFIEKPFDNDTVRALIKKIVEGGQNGKSDSGF